MGFSKSIQSLGILTFVVSSAVGIAGSLAPQPAVQATPEWLVSVNYPPVTNRRRISTTVAGGRRTTDRSCTRDATRLTALVPEDSVVTTAAPNPTLFVYVPQTQARAAEIVVVDDKGDDVYVSNLTLTNSSGVLKVTLPTTVALEPGKNYKWQFSVICNPRKRTEDVFVRGMFWRTELASQDRARLARTAPLAQATLYANRQLWNETLTTVAQLRSSAPREWEGLLRSVGLGAIAQKPFVDCCTLQN
jgi:hypothetical protein